MVQIELTERELALLIDATVDKDESLFDSIPFTINQFSVKRHLAEIRHLTNKLRGVRDGKN